MKSTNHTDQINAPIRERFFHDAHLWLMLFAFFIAVALPFRWHTIALWACAFCAVGFFQGITWRFALQSLALAFALSISIWLLNVFFHTEGITAEQAQLKANQTALKIWSLTWVALLSAKMINVRDVITYALQRRWLSTQIAYAMLVGIGAITLLRAESRRIMLNAKLRGIKGLQKFSQWIPLLIFSLRHAQRGAMSLRARGLTKDKVFYYNYQATDGQIGRSIALWLVLMLMAWASER